MGFRSRLKKTISRGSHSSSSDASSTISKEVNNVYKPGEKIPLKYKRPVDKAHKERLEAFQFADSWRRRSFQSVYSPMGSRMPSRRNSIEYGPTARQGFGRSYMAETIDGVDPEASNDSLSTSHPMSMAEKHDLSFNVVTDFADAPPTRYNSLFTDDDLAMALKRSRLSWRALLPETSKWLKRMTYHDTLKGMVYIGPTSIAMVYIWTDICFGVDAAGCFFCCCRVLIG